MKRIDLSFAVVLSILLMNGLVFSQDTTLTITSNGNVGIGTTTPTAKLDVDGSLAVGDLSRFGNHMLSSRVDSNNTAIDVAVFGSNEGTSGFKVGVLGRTQASTGYGVFSEGNIGVNGNATISGTMRVQNIHGDFTFDGFAPFLNTTLLNTFRGFNGNGPQIRFQGAPGFMDIGQDSTGSFVIEGSDIARLVVQNSGNVGIGTTTPEFKLQVAGEIKVQNGVIRFGDQTSHRWTVGPQIADDGYVIYANGAAGYVLVLNRTTGRVGIGTTTPDQLLSVNGNASKVGGGSWATFSDRRLKKEVNPFSDGLSVLKAIRPVTFRYNGKLNYPTDKTHVGVIAQEIQSVAPYTVDAFRAKLNPEDAEETDILRYESSALIYIAINAIKELDTKVNEIRGLQEENETLSARLSELESLVKSLAEEQKNVGGNSLGELR